MSLLIPWNQQGQIIWHFCSALLEWYPIYSGCCSSRHHVLENVSRTEIILLSPYFDIEQKHDTYLFNLHPLFVIWLQAKYVPHNRGCKINDDHSGRPFNLCPVNTRMLLYIWIILVGQTKERGYKE